MSRISILLFFGLVLLVSLGCGGGAKEGNAATEKPTTTGEDPTKNGKKDLATKPDFSLTAQEFVTDLRKEQPEIQAKYEGKIIALTGEVAMVQSGMLGMKEKSVIVILDTDGTTNNSDQCWLSPEHFEKGVLLSRKQKVKLVGKYRQFLPGLVDCSLEELTKSELLTVNAKDLAEAYSKDATATTKKYEGRHAILEGRVEKLTQESGHSYVWLSTTQKVSLKVRLTKDEHSTLKEGQQVRLRVDFKLSPFWANLGLVSFDYGSFIVQVK